MIKKIEISDIIIEKNKIKKNKNDKKLLNCFDNKIKKNYKICRFRSIYSGYEKAHY